MRNEYGLEISKTINKLIDTNKKIEKCRLGIVFIQTCLGSEKLPNFSRINLASKESTKDSDFVRKIRWEVTEKELEIKRNCMRKHNKVKIGLERRIVHLRPEHWEQLHEIIDFKIAI